MMEEIVVGQKFIGTRDDEKPIIGIHAGAKFFSVDTQDEYLFDGEQWVLTNLKSKSIERKSIQIEADDYYIEYLSCENYDLITSFAIASGDVRSTFRVADPSHSYYSWDSLGEVNSASIRNSAQASITELPAVALIIYNDGTEAVTVDLYIYLGRK